MRAKRSLGQNFLTSTAAIRAIVQAANVTRDDVVLEIGPGKGALTKEILAHAGKVIAIEKDDALHETLQETFADEIASNTLQLVHGDALEVDLNAIGLQHGTYKIVANIPFNITGALTRHYLSGTVQPTTMALVVQKEVAERIAMRDGKGSILSMSVLAYGTPKYIKTIKAGSFTPIPKVDSAIVLIDNISGDNFISSEQEKRFFELLRAGFSQKRKKVANNIAAHFPDNTIESVLDSCNIPHDARAETLTLEQWLCISNTNDI